jgi:hypothetical protein
MMHLSAQDTACNQREYLYPESLMFNSEVLYYDVLSFVEFSFPEHATTHLSAMLGGRNSFPLG